ncbi:MAG: hypothetical protein IT162_05765 [Bryobacterales bacterium]|nr:hypothetical protein [Bryobacterales bacterium]
MTSSVRNLALFFWAAATAAFAQNQPPPIRLLDFYYPKSSQVANLQTLQKEYAGILKKAGWDKPRMVYRAMSGPRALVVLRGYTSHADIPNGGNFPAKLKDVQTEVTTMTLRMSEASERVERYIDNVLPGLATGAPADPPRYYRTSTVQVKPEKIDEFLALVRNEILPAWKKAGVKAYAVTQRGFGGSRHEVRLAISLKSLTDLDEPIPMAKHLGAEEYKRFLVRYRALINDLEYNIFEFMPELSYKPGR